MPDRDDWIQEHDKKSTKLVRATDDRMIAGVCAGIARFFGWPANRVRIIYVAVSVLSAAFPGIIVYLVLWLLMPAEGTPRSFRLH
ncbi:MAG: PspC domain-containing protein [Longimicrobiales bacterium]